MADNFRKTRPSSTEICLRGFSGSLITNLIIFQNSRWWLQHVGSNMADNFLKKCSKKICFKGLLGSLISNLIIIFRNSKWRIQHGDIQYYQLCIFAYYQKHFTRTYLCIIYAYLLLIYASFIHNFLCIIYE